MRRINKLVYFIKPFPARRLFSTSTFSLRNHNKRLAVRRIPLILGTVTRRNLSNSTMSGRGVRERAGYPSKPQFFTVDVIKYTYRQREREGNSFSLVIHYNYAFHDEILQRAGFINPLSAVFLPPLQRDLGASIKMRFKFKRAAIYRIVTSIPFLTGPRRSIQPRAFSMNTLMQVKSPPVEIFHIEGDTLQPIRLPGRGCNDARDTDQTRTPTTRHDLRYRGPSAGFIAVI